MSTPDKEPTSNNPTCSYPNCYPEGGGEGEEKLNLKDTITWLRQHAQRNGSQAENNTEEVYYRGYVDGLNELANEMELSATVPAPEAQPIADGKEVPEWEMGYIDRIFNLVEHQKDIESDLLSARNEISTQGKQIAKLLAELKGCQENLTALIEVALQKSEQLDAARGYFEKIRQYLPHQISLTNPYK